MITETTDGVNISGNQLSIDCITSNQDKFHLDSDGNLTVNSITTIQNNPSGINLDTVYPIGSIYMNTTDINPSTLFGGTWEQLKDRFLLGVGDIYQAGSIGGEEKHTLTAAELPSLRPNFKATNSTTTGGSANYLYLGGTVSPAVATPTAGRLGITRTAFDPLGKDQPHNNMPPYLTVYMWKRIS